MRISRLILFLTDELLVLFVLVANGVQMVQHVVFFSLCTSSFFLSEGCNKLRERKDKEKEAEKEKERERNEKRKRKRTRRRKRKRKRKKKRKRERETKRERERERERERNEKRKRKRTRRKGEGDREKETERRRKEKEKKKEKETEIGSFRKGLKFEIGSCFCKRRFFLFLAPGSPQEKFATILKPGNKPIKVNWTLSWSSGLEISSGVVLLRMV